MKFQLEAPYKPAGDQPKAISALSKKLRDNNASAVLVGVTGSGKTMTMASVVQELQKPTLIITHNKTLAAQLYREFKNFFPENAVEYFISYYDYYQSEAYVPSSDTYIEKEATINKEIDMLRLRATTSLLEREDVIIVASVSCIFGLGSPKEYQKAILMLNVGEEIKRENMLTKLLKMQYNRNDISRERGTFQVRGDVVEILPAYSGDGIRIEFFGDEIERITKFDILTGNQKVSLSKAVVYSAKHFIIAESLLERALQTIKAELEEQTKFFQSQNKPLEEERIRQRTLFDLEMLKEMGYCHGIENYSRHLAQTEPGSRPFCLIDYFPENFLIIIDESHVSIPQIRGMHESDQSRKRTLVQYGFRLPSALDNRPLNFKEFELMTKNILYVSATPAEYELNKVGEYVEQIIRPTGLLDPKIEIRGTQKQIDDLAKEITIRTERQERVLITTLTKKMAEDLTEYYQDIGIRIRYMHSDIDSLERVEILRDLRKGDFDVLVGINLLREGLDLPEVSLIAILDADKEGFLRSKRSLIQTMGRAARNVNGMVIMYADEITDSMKMAIDETSRRRKMQEQYNQEHGIQPQTIQKKVEDIVEREKQDQTKKTTLLDDILKKYDRKKYTSKAEWRKKLEKEMLQSAEEFNFEKAAILRDILFGEKVP